MQRMDGIAQHHGKKALFFSTGGFTPKAKDWARARRIEMYEMPPVRQASLTRAVTRTTNPCGVTR